MLSELRKKSKAMKRMAIVVIVFGSIMMLYFVIFIRPGFILVRIQNQTSSEIIVWLNSPERDTANESNVILVPGNGKASIRYYRKPDDVLLTMFFYDSSGDVQSRDLTIPFHEVPPTGMVRVWFRYGFGGEFEVEVQKR